jgi:succinate dehydrogenase / fumarate reductase flavoprotein subunit
LELADVDITTGLMEVGPTCHYMMGGIRATPKPANPPCLVCLPQVQLPDFMARIASAETSSDLFAFGKRAGKAAADYAKSAERSAGYRAATRSGTRDAGPARTHQRRICMKFTATAGIHAKPAGIFRTEEDLQML